MSDERIGDELYPAELLPKAPAKRSEVYVDKTGTDRKPNPMRDVYLEFPRAMLAIAVVTAYGAEKHAPRGWQTFDPEYGLNYHIGKLGRHLLDRELHGEINHSDGSVLHAAQAAWNALALLENVVKLQEKDQGNG